MKKRVLIITYYWPPTSGSGVQRWLKMSKYLSALGWQSVIYTPSNPEAMLTDSSLEKDIPSDAEIIKRPITEPYGLYRRLLGKKQKGGESVNPIKNVGPISFKDKISLWIRANCFIPDPRIWWVNPSVRYLRKYLREHPVDVIVTTGPPHSMHLIGQKLSSQLNIRHIADFRDPWTTIHYFKHLPLWPLAKHKQKRLEGEVLFDADVVVSVTKRMTQELKELFLEYCEKENFLVGEAQKSKFYTVCNGYDEEDFPGRWTGAENAGVAESAAGDGGGEAAGGAAGDVCGEAANEREKSFCITHTGLLPSASNPEVLWKVLGQMCKEDRGFQNHLVIRLAGKVDSDVIESIRENGIGGNLINMGFVPHKECNILQQKAWLLLLPLAHEPESKRILLGKFFEYLAAGRPMIGFCWSESETAEVMADTSTGDVCTWDDETKVRAVIEKHYAKYLAGEWDFKPFKEAVQMYSRRKEAEEMAGLFEKRAE